MSQKPLIEIPYKPQPIHELKRRFSKIIDGPVEDPGNLLRREHHIHDYMNPYPVRMVIVKGQNGSNIVLSVTATFVKVSGKLPDVITGHRIISQYMKEIYLYENPIYKHWFGDGVLVQLFLIK